LYEGISCRNADALNAIRQDARNFVKQVRTSGAISELKQLLQIQSDLMGADIVVLKENDAVSRGAALCAGIGVGYFKGL